MHKFVQKKLLPLDLNKLRRCCRTVEGLSRAVEGCCRAVEPGLRLCWSHALAWERGQHAMQWPFARQSLSSECEPLGGRSHRLMDRPRQSITLWARLNHARHLGGVSVTYRQSPPAKGPQMHATTRHSVCQCACGGWGVVCPCPLPAPPRPIGLRRGAHAHVPRIAPCDARSRALACTR